jgi:hypothetical protein
VTPPTIAEVRKALLVIAESHTIPTEDIRAFAEALDPDSMVIFDRESLAKALDTHNCADALLAFPIKCGHDCADAILIARREQR